MRDTLRADRAALPVFLLAVVAGASYYATYWIAVDGPVSVAWKGAGVGLLALWAGSRARDREGWLIAAVLACGALGDVLLETAGLTIGALAFLAGHILAMALYLGRRAGPRWIAAAIAVAVAVAAWSLPDARGAAPGIALYALGLGAMAGCAAISRFPAIVALGAALFVVSDLLIFARMGPMGGSPVPGLLIWPTYFGGQAMIAWGVVTTLRARE